MIIRFTDLSQRDEWLAGTSNLKGLEKNFSLTPDLPPVIRPYKDQLMLQRKQMPAEVKSKTRIRYLPKWPFVELRTEGQPPVRPDVTLRDITPTILGLNHVYSV